MLFYFMDKSFARETVSDKKIKKNKKCEKLNHSNSRTKGYLEQLIISICRWI